MSVCEAPYHTASLEEEGIRILDWPSDDGSWELLVLVARELNEGGVKYEDAVQFIRQKQCGAFNSKKLLYLEKYCPTVYLPLRN
ncbi:hypothetical protein GH733_019292, partial [Mirounga leonina]